MVKPGGAAASRKAHNLVNGGGFFNGAAGQRRSTVVHARNSVREHKLLGAHRLFVHNISQRRLVECYMEKDY
ncbi:hypothetical protein M0R45_018959 [Rubus argutus]|uniref:Uncharacterized protein n=1 Tax=Rubus argutus TaxID=59490 RepID=A0AAW1X6D6_RUBAR